jgi:transcriptional regulator GlxA family with amidase domain
MDPQAQVQKAIEMMKEDTRRAFSTADMARHAQLSPRRFSYLFREETGTTPARFLKSLRMLQAKDLLENTFLGTKEIMRKVGFSSDSHFARDFKRYYGMTPGQYRLVHLARRLGDEQSAEGRADERETA